MSNQVSEYLDTRLSLARKELVTLVQGYQELNDDGRLAKSQSAFYQVNSYVQLERAVILPVIEKQNENEEALSRSNAILTQIRDILDRATMIHVDEPDNEYYDNICSLLVLVEALNDHDHATILPWLEKNMTMEEAASLMPRLKENAMQDALPSF